MQDLKIDYNQVLPHVPVNMRRLLINDQVMYGTTVPAARTKARLQYLRETNNVYVAGQKTLDLAVLLRFKR